VLTISVPFRLLRMALAAVAVLIAASAAVRADDFAALVQRLAAGDFTEKLAAVEAVAASGDARAAGILQALLEGRLLRLPDGSVGIAAASPGAAVVTDALTDALTGAALEIKPGEAELVSINNRLRGVIRGVLGSLTLLSREPAQRRAAADAVFKARDQSRQPLLEQALATESDAAVKARMERALAAVETMAADPATRLQAIAVLKGFPDPEVSSLLAGLAQADADAAVRAAAAEALAGIATRLALWSAIGSLFQGVSLGSVLLLAAVGLAITFGVMGVINMAHGEMVMLGAYTTFVVQEQFRAFAPGAFDWSLAVAIPLAFIVAGAVGVAIERGIIRFLYGRPLETLLATWGVSLILQQAVRTLFGPSNREVGNPSWMSGAIEVVGGLTLTYNRIWIIVFSLLIFAGLMLLIKRTAFGMQMRAVTQNRPMAASMGIRTGWVDAMTFGLGSGIAGIAGVALSQIDNVSPNLGQAYIIDSFLVVVFGGVGNLWGTLVGALSLGMVNKLIEPYAGAVLGKILILVAIILFIQKRPRGLFALKGRAVES
jgi:urea transport system permease protein